VPAGTLGTTGILTFRALVRGRCTSANANTLTVDIEYGGSSMGSFGDMGSNNNYVIAEIRGTLAGDGATNAQVGLVGQFGRVATASNWTNAGQACALAVDSTVDQDLKIYCTNSRLNADASWTYYYFAVFGLP